MTSIITLSVLLVILVGGWFTSPVQKWLKKENQRYKDEYKHAPKWSDERRSK
jgi:hypothetical protein